MCNEHSDISTTRQGFNKLNFVEAIEKSDADISTALTFCAIALYMVTLYPNMGARPCLFLEGTVNTRIH